MSKRPADDEPAADDAKQARLTIGVPAPPPSRIGGADGRKNYELGEVLGEGAFAIVHRAMCLENSTEYAVKLIDKDGTDLAEAKRERSILERVGMHKHVAGLFDSFVQPSAWVLVLELAEGGEVFERICDGGPFSEADAAAVVRQVALALQHINGLGVVHRDLKPENLLLVSQATRKELGLLWRKDAHVKVADFGLASLVGEPPEGERGAVAGTVTYMAPELFGPKGEGTGTRPVGPGLDVWSVGVILFVRHPRRSNPPLCTESPRPRVHALSPHAHTTVRRLVCGGRTFCPGISLLIRRGTRPSTSCSGASRAATGASTTSRSGGST
jgi:serine/threonine protein kinase